jgi:hypothetical protein
LKDRYEKLRGLLEGLGVGALENSKDQTQERLLAALSDLRIMKEQRDSLAEALIEVAEAGMGLMNAAPNADPAAKLTASTNPSPRRMPRSSKQAAARTSRPLATSKTHVWSVQD